MKGYAIAFFYASIGAFTALLVMELPSFMVEHEPSAFSVTSTHSYAGLRGTPIPGGICLHEHGVDTVWCVFEDSELGLVVMQHTTPHCFFMRGNTPHYCLEHDALGRWLVVPGAEEED